MAWFAVFGYQKMAGHQRAPLGRVRHSVLFLHTHLLHMRL